MSSPLNQRGILRGVQCVCGQWWPDYQRTGHPMQFRTECCGSLYQHMTGEGSVSTLSLIERGPGLPTEAETLAALQAPETSQEVTL